MSSRLFADISIIQSLPPSNVNRDDSGSPKHAEFGGVKRARISSQAQKRQARKHFAEHLPQEDRATRTSRIQQLLTERLLDRHESDETAVTRLVAAAMGSLGITASSKNAERTSYLLFCGYRQINDIVGRIDERFSELAALEEGKPLDDAVKKLQLVECIAKNNPAEVALFGRMVANSTDLNVDGAVQVAHAVSTHRVHNKFDYFTAVDDENTESTGAGMVGNVEFNSATYYRYATIGIHQLQETLGDPALCTQAAAGFLRGFTMTLPTGHTNSFAHHTRPHAVVVALRTDQPVNLVNAFEKPIAPQQDSGFAERSILELAEEFAKVTDVWGQAPEAVLATYATGGEPVKKQFGAGLSFPQLVSRFETAVSGWFESVKIG